MSGKRIPEERIIAILQEAQAGVDPAARNEDRPALPRAHLLGS